jgi:phage I-like protein
MEHIVHLHFPMPEGGADAVPEWVHLAPAAGTFRGFDGRGPYRVGDIAALAAASLASGQGAILIDENHSTDLAAPRGEKAPARGWVREMQARADGLWGKVEWTPEGRALVANREYRGISPAMAVDAKDNTTVRAVLRASLTNNPNLKQLATLHSKQEPAVDLVKLRASLGLADDADEAAILAAAEAARTAISTHAAQLAQIATAAKAEKPEAAAIVTALQARGADDADALRGTVTTLQAELTTLKADRAKERATQVVDDAIRAGKPIPKTLRDHYIARHAADPAAVEKELAGLPSLHAGGVTQPPAEGAAGGADPVVLAAAATAYQLEQAGKGNSIGFAEAVTHVSQKGTSK